MLSSKNDNVDWTRQSEAPSSSNSPGNLSTLMSRHETTLRWCQQSVGAYHHHNRLNPCSDQARAANKTCSTEV